MRDTLLNDIELRTIFARFAAAADVAVEPFLIGLTNLEAGCDDRVSQLRMTASNGDEILAVVPHNHDEVMLVVKTINHNSVCDELDPDGRMERFDGEWITNRSGERQFGVFEDSSYSKIDHLKVGFRRHELRALVRDVMPA